MTSVENRLKGDKDRSRESSLEANAIIILMRGYNGQNWGDSSGCEGR